MVKFDLELQGDISIVPYPFGYMVFLVCENIVTKRETISFCVETGLLMTGVVVVVFE